MSEKTPDQIVSEYWGHFHGGTMSFETVVKEIVRSEREASERKVEMLKKALEKINTIRNSIVAFQSCNFSEHVYPLVAALQEAGIEGMPYPDALGYFGTMLERTNKAEAALKRIIEEENWTRADCASLAASTLEEAGK